MRRIKRTDQEKTLLETSSLLLEPRKRSLRAIRRAVLKSKGAILQRQTGGYPKYVKIPSRIPIEQKTALMLLVEQITEEAIENLLFSGMSLPEMVKRCQGIVDDTTLCKWRKRISEDAEWRGVKGG